jgi:hypothetical protein
MCWQNSGMCQATARYSFPNIFAPNRRIDANVVRRQLPERAPSVSYNSYKADRPRKDIFSKGGD